MEKKLVNRYDFNSVVSKMKKNIDIIKHGEENSEKYFYKLAVIEIIIFRHANNYEFNCRQIKEILQLALLEIKGLLLGISYDYDEFLDEGYEIFLKDILKTFSYKESSDLESLMNQDIELKELFELPTKILIRIWESVDTWSKEDSKKGYIEFIRNFINSEIKLKHKYIIDSKYLESIDDEVR